MRHNGGCHSIVDEYLEWLRQGIEVYEENGVCEITTPFLDRHNDHLAVFVTEADGRYTLSDDGYILADLQMAGVDITTEHRQEVITSTLRGFGVMNRDESLVVECQRRDLPRAKHNLLQAMLALNELYVTSKEHVFSFFLEDVREFFKQRQVRYIAKIRLVGQSGFEHSFDFAIQPSRSQPERLIRAIGNPNRDTIISFCFSWQDTSKERDTTSRAIAILNDRDHSVSSDLTQALQEYKIQAMPWKLREQLVSQLVA